MDSFAKKYFTKSFNKPHPIQSKASNNFPTRSDQKTIPIFFLFSLLQRWKIVSSVFRKFSYGNLVVVTGWKIGNLPAPLIMVIIYNVCLPLVSIGKMTMQMKAAKNSAPAA